LGFAQQDITRHGLLLRVIENRLDGRIERGSVLLPSIQQRRTVFIGNGTIGFNYGSPVGADGIGLGTLGFTCGRGGGGGPVFLAHKLAKDDTESRPDSGVMQPVNVSYALSVLFP
jgi:hypothetical protein